MEASSFVDYYKIMGVKPDVASADLERRFHRLAKRYHPDNPQTGNRERFDLLIEAHNMLKDASRRSQYDILYKQVVGSNQPFGNDGNGSDTVGQDVDIQSKLLSVFYNRRRHNIRDPGVPEVELERIFGCKIENLEFHLWYLKAKRWIERLENGMFSITVEGIDHINSEHNRKTTTMLLMDRSQENDDLD
ncbi:J domain-containing protein [Aestuariivirga litoralis]|uniref:J domain-containing protein n=2 Tax=Aestuariivirga litoralis TaxID=2650924 RepID=A0A2W2BMV6_9HYPH|nr:J domain-containing protein [Aestuariivirga litoralis]